MNSFGEYGRHVWWGLSVGPIAVLNPGQPGPAPISPQTAITVESGELQ